MMVSDKSRTGTEQVYFTRKRYTCNIITNTWFLIRAIWHMTMEPSQIIA